MNILATFGVGNRAVKAEPKRIAEKMEYFIHDCSSEEELRLGKPSESLGCGME
jgi:hypothetical protein